MSSFEQLSNHIESKDFRFKLNVATSYSMFENLLSEDETFLALTKLANQEEGEKEILQRLNELLTKEVDSNYAHPDDTAIAVYLLVLKTSQAVQILEQIEDILEQDNFWWAHNAAKALIPLPLKSSNLPK